MRQPQDTDPSDQHSRRDKVLIAQADPASPAAQHGLTRFFAELNLRFDGGFSSGPHTSRDLDSLRPPKGAFFVALRGTEPVGCVGIVQHSPVLGEVKRLWVAPAARGSGIASRLMAKVETHACSLGLTRLQLDTNRTLTDAIAMYRAKGWQDVPRYNDNPYADHWFEKSLPTVVVAGQSNQG